MDIKLIKKLRVELEQAISRGDNAEAKILEERIETMRVSINESRKSAWRTAFHSKK